MVLFVHNVELKPGGGAVIARAAGCCAQIVGRDGQYVLLRLRSGQVRLILSSCKATIGIVSNLDHKNRKLGKAGRSRWLGIRPAVRGVAMNPIDHPHGGGEGKLLAVVILLLLGVLQQKERKLGKKINLVISI